MRRLHSRQAEWISRYPIFCDESTAARYLRAGAPELACAVTPGAADIERFSLTTDFITWLFALDDVFCDESATGDPQAYLDVLPFLLAVFDETKAPAPAEHAFVAALDDIRRRMLRLASVRQVALFGALLREFMLCLVWELQVRASARLPGYFSYRNMRRRTGGTLPCIVLTAMASGADPDPEELLRPEVAAMTELCSDHVVLANDLFSGAKEAQLETMPLRLPLVLMHERGIEADQAERLSVGICDAVMREFLERQARAEVGASAQLRGYFEVLRGWMRGNIDWSSFCGRYNHWAPAHADASMSVADLGR